MDPQRGDGQQVTLVEATREERETLEEAELEVDGEAPQVENAEIQSPKRKVIRVGSEETQHRKKQRIYPLCRVPSANHEDPFIGARIDAVKKLSGTGRLRRWWLNKVEEPTQSTYVSGAVQRTVGAAGQAAVEIVAIYTRHVRAFHSQKGSSKKDSRRCSAGKAKKGSKVSGNRNHRSGRFWSKLEETQIWDVAPS